LSIAERNAGGSLSYFPVTLSRYFC